MSGVCVMCRLFMLSGSVVCGRFLVVLRGMLMMFRSLGVMAMRRMGLSGFLSHAFSP